MKTKRTYEYIKIKLIDKARPGHPSQRPKTRTYEIKSSDGKILYGQVRWHNLQRRYVFHTDRLRPIKSAAILQDIGCFIDVMMKERKDGKRA